MAASKAITRCLDFAKTYIATYENKSVVSYRRALETSTIRATMMRAQRSVIWQSG